MVPPIEITSSSGCGENTITFLAILRRGYTAGGGPGLHVSGMDIK